MKATKKFAKCAGPIIEEYVAAQSTLQFYEETKKAFVDVLSPLLDDEFEIVKNKLVLVVLHEGQTGSDEGVGIGRHV